MPGRCLVAISVLGLALARPGLEPAREALYLYADSKAAETPKRDHQTAEGRQPPLQCPHLLCFAFTCGAELPLHLWLRKIQRDVRCKWPP